MNASTIQALGTALYYCRAYEQSNPEVGMGMFDAQLLNKVLETAGLRACAADREAILRYEASINSRGDYHRQG